MKKRILSIALVLCMVLALMPTALAADGDGISSSNINSNIKFIGSTTLAAGSPTTYNLYVNGVSVTSENASNVLNDTDTGTVSYDADSKTLTLNGATLTTEKQNDPTNLYNAVIFYSGATDNNTVFTVNVVGDNTITSDDAVGIFSTCNLRLTGTGTLTVTSPMNAVGASINVAIDSGTYDLTSTRSENDTYGRGFAIYAASITFSGSANVTAKSDLYGALYAYNFNNVSVYDGISISGNANVCVTSQKNVGIYTQNKLTVSDNASVAAVGGTQGIQAHTGIDITGGTVDATGKTGPGIFAVNCALSISGAETVVTAAAEATNQAGIFASGAASITNKATVHATGMPYGIYVEENPLIISADAVVTAENGSNHVAGGTGSEIKSGTFSNDPTSYLPTEGYIVRKDSDTSYTVVAKENLTSGVYMSDPSGSVASGYVVSGSGPYTVSVYIPTTTTTTTTNDDGSKTTTTTDKSTGTTTETTTSQPVTDEAGNTTQTTTETVTQKDGSTTETVTETVKAADGSTTETVTETATDKDGVTTSTETVTTTDTTGTTATKVTETDATGDTSTTVTATVSDKAVEEAAQEETSVTLPVEVTAAESKDATAITVQVPASVDAENTVKVEIPVENLTTGTVAVIVNEDGTEEIVKTSTMGEEGVVLTLEGNATVKIVDNSKIFEDVHPVDHWAEDAVTYVAAREIFNGTGTSERNTFSPDEDLTRAMLMTVLARYDGEDTTGGETWYEQGMNWAVQNGVSDGTKPETPITREQMVTMLWRYFGSPTVEDSIDHYSDEDHISDWAKEAMRWAVSTGIINGVGNNTLEPQGNATRAQVAAVMMRFCEKINK